MPIIVSAISSRIKVVLEEQLFDQFTIPLLNKICPHQISEVSVLGLHAKPPPSQGGHNRRLTEKRRR